MMNEALAAVIPVVLSGALSFIGAWAAIRVEMRWMRADIDRLSARLDKLETAHA